MDTISSLLSKYKQGSDINSKITKELFFAKLKDCLKTTLTETELNLTKPGYIKNNVLKFYCKNSVIASILKIKENEILKKINEIAPEFKIEKLNFEIKDDLI